jgi:ABC-2 type transport system ATP-binding protein
MGAIIETQSLTRRYGSRVGVESIDLSVSEGSIFGFLGPNGAGKTTAIRVLLGLLRPSSGGARILGRDCWADSPTIKRDVGYVPGDLRLYSWMNGERALQIASLIRGQDLFPAGRRLAQLFDLNLRLRVRSMSRGTRQKLGLILALAHQPRVLILDEPTVTLDPLMQDALQQHLRELAQAGHTVFFSSHTLNEVERLCDRVAIIRQGKIVANESLDQLRSRSGRLVTLRWPDESTAGRIIPPVELHLALRDGTTWRGSFTGPVAPFLRWAAAQPLIDIEIGRPDLETLFQHFYQKVEGSG